MSENNSYSIDDLSRLLSVNTGFIYRIIHTGKIRIKSNRISQENLDDYMSKYGDYLYKTRIIQ